MEGLEPDLQKSFTAQSDSSTALEPNSSSRLFHVYHAPFHRNLDITTEDKTHLYYMDNSIFTPEKPDLTFHAGRDRFSPIAAVCKFLHFSGDSRVGLGDPKDPNNVVWEALTKMSMDYSKFRWEMAINPEGHSNPGAGRGERKAFLWKRTHHVGIGDSMPPPLSQRNFKLVSEETGDILAVYIDKGLKAWTKRGKFQINVDYGPDFDTMVLVTGLTLVERWRRRNH